MSPTSIEDPRVILALNKIVTQQNVVIDLLRVISYLMPEPVGPAQRLTLSVGPITKQGVVTSMQIHDDEQFDLSLSAVDAKGQAVTSDLFTATSSDEGVVTVVDTGTDSFTVVAGLPGSAVITISDGTISVTEAVDVVAGSVATVSIVEGAVIKQPPPAEPPA